MDNNTPTNAAQPGSKPVGQTPTPAPAASAPAPATPTPAAPAPVEPTPAEPAPVPEAPATPAAPGTPTPEAPKDKKKTGLIIGIIVGAIVLIGGITAAAIALMAPKPDPVATAIEKLINHEERRNLKIGGGVKISLPDNPDSVTSLQIDLDSQIVGDSLLNASTITGKVAFKDGEEISAGIDEVYSESGDLYFRLSNAADAIQKYLKHESSSSQDCYAVLDGEDLCSDLEDTEVENNVTIDLVDEIDGEWMRVSVDELGSYMGSTAIDLESGEEVESQTTCVTDFANEIKQNTNGIAEAYKNNPFIKSSQENITVVKKANPIYEITVDSEKLVGFSKQMEQFQPVKNFADCMGMDQFKIDEDKIAEAIEALPKLYLEIDGKYDITRLYFEYPFENVQASVTVDLDFAYPDTVNIAEPKEYKDFSKTIEEFVSKMMMIE